MRFTFNALLPLAAIVILLNSAVTHFHVTAKEEATPDGARVVVLDVAKVVKQTDVFNSKLAAIKKDVASISKKFENAKKHIAKLNAALRRATKGSEEFIRLEKEIATDSAAMKADLARIKATMLSREADAYKSVYRKITKVVAKYAERQGVELVIRFQSNPFDPQSREDILKGVNRMIVYQRGRDITGEIVALMNNDDA